MWRINIVNVTLGTYFSSSRSSVRSTMYNLGLFVFPIGRPVCFRNSESGELSRRGREEGLHARLWRENSFGNRKEMEGAGAEGLKSLIVVVVNAPTSTYYFTKQVNNRLLRTLHKSILPPKKVNCKEFLIS